MSYGGVLGAGSGAGKRSAPACGVAGRVSFKREAGPHSHLLDITFSFGHRARLSDAGKIWGKFSYVWFTVPG